MVATNNLARKRKQKFSRHRLIKPMMEGILQARLSYLIPAFFLLNVFIAAATTVESQDEFKKLYGQVFATKGSPIPVDKTYEVLLKLSELEPDKGNSRAYLETLEPLIDASKNVIFEKCTEEYFYFLNLLIKYTSYYTLNLQPYLRSARKRQFEVCQDLFAFEVVKIVSSFPDLKLDDITDLRDNILSATGYVSGFKHLMEFLSSSDICEGILSYLEKKNALKGTNFCTFDEKTLDLLGEKIMSSVGRNCFMVQAILYYSPIVTIKDLANDKEIEQTMNPLIKEWLMNSMICDKIINDMPGVTEGVYRILRDRRRSNLSFQGLFFQCLPFNKQSHGVE